MKSLALIFPTYYPALQFGGPAIASKTFFMMLGKSLKISMVTTDVGLSEGDVQLAQKDGHVIPTIKLRPLDKFGVFTSDYRNLYKIIKNSNYVYLRGIWCYISVVALIFSIYLKKHIIVASTGKIPALSRLDYSKITFKTYVKIFFIKILLRQSKYIHFTSLDELKASQTFLDKHAIAADPLILPTAIPFDMSESFFGDKCCEGKSLNFLILSRLDPIKNITTSLELFSRLLKDFPGSKLNVVGEFSSKAYKMECLNVIERARIVDAVHFHGQLDRNAVIKILRRSQIFIQMSDTEGFSNSILEAQAAGLFLIISQGCNYTPSERHGIVLKDIDTVDDLAIKINRRQTKALISKQAYGTFGMDALANHYSAVIAGLDHEGI